MPWRRLTRRTRPMMGLTKPSAFVCSTMLTASYCTLEPVRNPPPDHLQENRVSIPLARSLSSQGIDTKAEIHANLGTAQLVEEELKNGEGALSLHGALVVKTGAHTGRSADRKSTRLNSSH